MSFYRFADCLKYEAQQKRLFEQLFDSHDVRDVGNDKAARKAGIDYYLQGEHAPIGIENKFERFTSGNLVLEFVSIDRPRITPGWLYTSRAAWLMSWFPSGDIVVLPMDGVRKFVLPQVGRGLTTTTRNPSYLTWNLLERINTLVLGIEDARVLDMRSALGLEFLKPSLISRSAREKACTVEELVTLMRERPPASRARRPREVALVEAMRRANVRNLKREAHAPLLASLLPPWRIAA